MLNTWAYRQTWTQLALRKDLIGCEIGVAKGVNSFYILSNLNIKKLYLIDPYFAQSDEFTEDGERPYIEGIKHSEAEEIARKTLNKFKDKVQWLVGTTKEMIENIPDNSLDFCYIDGDHKYESVKLDIELCLPKVKIGAVLGGHDFCNDHKSVVRAVLEKFGKDKLFVGGRDWWIVKKTQIG